jgi:hypothetical protein
MNIAEPNERTLQAQRPTPSVRGASVCRVHPRLIGFFFVRALSLTVRVKVTFLDKTYLA